ncbi:MAG TPA: PadR family transcriptional regulator [Acidothermaceae bacterium]|nr:PadR family transcriptional regulator [Acidothermaceae bacterium]
MARRQRSNPLALAVLACLVERPMHPYEISTTLRSRGKELSIKLNYGSLYSVVESLEKHGLIRARETTREGRRPERTVYEITDAGEIECEDWLAELISVPVREFTSLEAGLSLLPLLEPNEAARLLDERAERLRIDQRGIDAAHAEAKSMQLPELFLIESVFRRTMLAAELEFVTTLARDIRSGAFKGTDWWQRIHDLRAVGIGFEELAQDPVTHLGEEAARWFNQPQSN